MWGLMAPVAKLVMAAGIVSPLLMGGFRMAGAAMLFWIASLFVPRQHVPFADLLRLAGAAMLGIVFNQGCYLFGVSLSSPGEASVITTTMPLWVMLLAALILKEPVTLRKIGGIVIGGAGALILVMSNTGSSGSESGSSPVAGDLLVLTAQLSYALYLTFYRNFIRKYSVITLMKWMFAFATVAVAPFVIPEALSTDWNLVTPVMSAGVAYVVVVGTFLAYILVMTGQQILRPTLIGMYNYVQPIVASAIGIAMGLDSFTPLKALAVVLVFGGVFLVNISKAAPSPATPENK